MLWVNLPVVGTIHSKGNKFDTDMKTKAMGDPKLNDRPTWPILVPVV